MKMDTDMKVSRSLLRRVGSGLLGVFLMGVVLGGARQSIAAPALKIAIVDMGQAMNEVAEGKAARQKIEKRMKERRDELDKKQKELQSMQEDLQKKAAVLSDEVKAAKAQEFQAKYQDYEKTRLAAENEMAAMQQQLQDDLTERIRKVIASIAQQEGYTLVLEKQMAWYNLPTYDITQEVIQAFNAKTKK